MQTTDNILRTDLMHSVSDPLVELFSEVAAEAAKASGYDVPSTLLAIAARVASSLIVKKTGDLYNDIKQRNLSYRQISVFKYVLGTGYGRFLRLVEENDWNLEHPESQSFVERFYENGEHLLLEAMSESQQKKLDAYSSLMGRLIYEHSSDWDNQFFDISTLSKLSFRQLVLIKLIVEGFPGIDKSLSITDPCISSELKELAPLFWHIEKGVELSSYLETSYLGCIVKSTYSSQFYEKLLLNELINDGDVEEIKMQMRLRNLGSSDQLYIDPNGNYAEPPKD